MAEEQKKEEVPEPVYAELATTQDGRDITRPYIHKMEEFRDAIVVTKGNGSLKVFTEVLRDDQVKSTFEQRVKAVISRPFVVSPGGDQPIDEEAAAWLTEELSRIGFDKVVSKMLYGNFYGYSVAEMLWEIRDGKVSIGKIKVRDRTRFRYDKHRNLRLLTIEQPFEGELQPDRKYWTYSSGSDHDDEPYGMGLAHWLYWPVFFKRGGIRLWLRFLDKFSAPTKVGKYHAGATTEERDRLLGALAALEVDSGVAIPANMEVELLEAQRSGSADYDKIYERMDKAITKIVLSQTMTTDDGSSLSQAQVHEGVRDDVAEGDGDLICCSFREGPVTWLMQWNFPGAAIPKVAFMHEDEEDLNQAADRDVRLKTLGFELTDEAFTEKYGEGYVRTKGGGNTNSEANDDQEGSEPDGEDEEEAFTDSEPDALNALGDEALGQALQSFRAELLDPVLELAEESTDFDDFVSKLDTLMGRADDQTVELMAQTFFMARGAGATGLDGSATDNE